jgi:hypothetical protein
MQPSHTFISYAKADSQFALKLANDLRAAGVNIWLDQIDIPPGAPWERSVQSAVNSCGRLLVILSPKSAESDGVSDEIGVAFDEKKSIIPILYLPCNVPMRLRRLQYIDFTVDYDRGLQRLLAVLKLPIVVPAGGGEAEIADAVGGGGSRTQTQSVPASLPTPVITAPVQASSRRRNALIGMAVAAVLLLLWISIGSGDSVTEGAAEAEDLAGASEGSVSTFASLADVTIVNDSDWQIHEIYMKRSTEQEWGPDRLGANVIIDATGGTHTLTQIPCESYDVKLVDQDGDVCEIPEQMVCDAGAIMTITSEYLLACQVGQ